MAKTATIMIKKSGMHFSAGHFTIFSATDREPLHGHNYQVALKLTFVIEENGLSFDYRHYKMKIIQLCKQIDQHFILPTESTYLRLEDDGDYTLAHFNDEKIPFLKKDIVLLPIVNVTVEELSHWFLNRLLLDNDELDSHRVQKLTLQVHSGEGQWGASTWVRGQEEVNHY